MKTSLRALRLTALMPLSLVSTAALVVACSDDPAPAPAPPVGSPDAGGGNGASFDTATAAAGEIQVSISGEEAAVSGFAFPGAEAGETFVDGWELKFDKILVTVGEITLSDAPDTSPTDQSQTGGVVARAAGPWAVNLAKPGTLAGKTTTALTAKPIGTFHTKADGSKFDPTTRYAFGYDVVAARADARRIDFDESDEALYGQMVESGQTVLYVGKATWKGGEACSATGNYDFASLPTAVNFRFGFRAPTAYANCQNTDLDGAALGSDESQRGINVKGNAPVSAQLTFHVEHPFWDSVVHDEGQLSFDAIAANAAPRVGQGLESNVTFDDLARVDITAVKDRAGRPVPYRSCVPGVEPKRGTRAFNSGNLAIDPSSPDGSKLRGYADYMTYLQSTMGHLNADGLCAPKRNYSSPL